LRITACWNALKKNDIVYEIHSDGGLTFLGKSDIARKKLLWPFKCAIHQGRDEKTNRVQISRIVEGANPDKTDWIACQNLSKRMYA